MKTEPELCRNAVQLSIELEGHVLRMRLQGAAMPESARQLVEAKADALEHIASKLAVVTTQEEFNDASKQVKALGIDLMLDAIDIDPAAKERPQ